MDMRRRRALIAAASAVAVIATGTAAAAANFGLLGANDKQLPAGHLDLAMVNAGVTVETATTVAGAIRVELEDGVIHIFQPDGTEVTVPIPPSPSNASATTPSTISGTDSGDGQPEQTSVTSNTVPGHRTTTTPPATTPRHDDDHGPAEPSEPDDD